MMKRIAKLVIVDGPLIGVERLQRCENDGNYVWLRASTVLWL